MDRKQDDREFLNVLSRVVSDHVTDCTIVFQDKYQIFLAENWKPWINLPDDLFKKSFIVCSTKENVKEWFGKTCPPTNAIIDKVSLASTTKKRGNILSENISDFTGCPLDCVFEISLHENSPKTAYESLKNHKSRCWQCPISASEARYLFELYKMPFHNEDIRKIPLFAFCDGKDPQHTILMGLVEGKRVLFQNRGPYFKKSDFHKFSAIKKCHLKHFPASFSSIETSFYAYYDALTYRPSDVAPFILKPCKTSMLSLECAWERIASVLQKPPADATCTLNVQVLPSDGLNGAVAKFKELKLLKALYDCLLTSRMIWPNNNSDDGVLNKVALFMTEKKATKKSNMSQEQFISDISDFNVAFPSAVMEDRNDIDFTDQLWIILKECSSYSTLNDALKLVFSELNSYTFPPFVDNKNMTTIGRIVRNLNKHPVYPNLESSVPIKLLFEIGLEKLQKDYMALFVGFELASYETFSPYVPKDRLSENSVRYLEKLQTVLELILICWTHLRLPKMELGSITKAALKHYTLGADVDPAYIFKFPVSPFSVDPVLEKLEATCWQSTLRSNCGGYKKQTMFHITKKPVCQQLSTEKIFDCPPPVQIPLYLCTTAEIIDDDCYIMNTVSNETSNELIGKNIYFSR